MGSVGIRDPILEKDSERVSQHKCTNDTLSKMELLQFFGCVDDSGGNNKATSSSHGRADRTADVGDECGQFSGEACASEADRDGGSL